MSVHSLATSDGRTLEVWEYGDPSGRPAIFFHGLVGSHHQASYVADEAASRGLRLFAPNRPGVGNSTFARRQSPLDAVGDVEALAAAFRLDRFSLIGISGGAPYVLATLFRWKERVRTATLISGMGPLRLPGALQGMDRSRRVAVELASRYPNLGRAEFRKWSDRFHANPTGFLDRMIATWSPPDRVVFERRTIYDLFLRDMEQVFNDHAPEGLAQELTVYRNFGFPLEDLPKPCRVTLWQGLDDAIVPPSMAWKLVQALPNAEAHFVPGGHFVAVDIAARIMARLAEQLDEVGE